MAKKKKGSKKSKKSDKEEYLPCIYNIPTYDVQDPELTTPKVDLIIKLANPVSEVLALRIKVPISTRVEKIHQEISKMHQGAISNILLCKDRFNPEEALDPMKTLEQCGILDGEIKCLYDYKPVTGPLLK